MNALPALSRIGHHRKLFLLQSKLCHQNLITRKNLLLIHRIWLNVLIALTLRSHLRVKVGALTESTLEFFKNAKMFLLRRKKDSAQDSSEELPELPYEIHSLYIFALLPTSTLLDCCLVSSLWREMLSDEQFWRMVGYSRPFSIDW